MGTSIPLLVRLCMTIRPNACLLPMSSMARNLKPTCAYVKELRSGAHR